MRAAIIGELNGTPRVAEHAKPEPLHGHSLVEIVAGAIGPTDLMRASGTYKPPTFPYIVGGEGIGRLADGTRVYFGHSHPPFGALSEWTSVPDDEIWTIPDDIEDGLAIALGISGTGALIPLEQAGIGPGERVLILGATGPLGQIALQASRVLGAGTVIAAARTRSALERMVALGHADDFVQLGTGDDQAALKSKAGPGYDVVLDIVYGPPAEAAMRCTAIGGRMMSIGVQAGNTVTLSLKDLVMRSHHGVGTGQRPVAERRAAYERLLRYGSDGRIKVDVMWFALDDAADAWEAQRNSPGAKIIVTTGR
ncbi:MAG: quinone oxidoreductase family protein [Janthinobacterium lividum]